MLLNSIRISYRALARPTPESHYLKTTTAFFFIAGEFFELLLHSGDFFLQGRVFGGLFLDTNLEPLHRHHFGTSKLNENQTKNWYYEPTERGPNCRVPTCRNSGGWRVPKRGQLSSVFLRFLEFSMGFIFNFCSFSSPKMIVAGLL